MLFRKKIARQCTYCEYSTILEDGKLLCARKGIRQPEDQCWRFHYDPFKRIPAKTKALDFSKFDQEDFSL